MGGIFMSGAPMSEIKIVLYRGANSPPIKVPLPPADYSGSAGGAFATRQVACISSSWGTQP